MNNKFIFIIINIFIIYNLINPMASPITHECQQEIIKIRDNAIETCNQLGIINPADRQEFIKAFVYGNLYMIPKELWSIKLLDSIKKHGINSSLDPFENSITNILFAAGIAEMANICVEKTLLTKSEETLKLIASKKLKTIIAPIIKKMKENIQACNHALPDNKCKIHR